MYVESVKHEHLAKETESMQIEANSIKTPKIDLY
jgi:hypothetical protein